MRKSWRNDGLGYIHVFFTKTLLMWSLAHENTIVLLHLCNLSSFKTRKWWVWTASSTSVIWCKCTGQSSAALFFPQLPHQCWALPVGLTVLSHHPSSTSLPLVELQHFLREWSQEVRSVHRERADVQHRQISRKLLEQSAAAGVPHLRRERRNIRQLSALQMKQ